MDHDVIELDQFERRHVGHFVIRVNHAHVGRCVAVIRPRQESFRVEPARLAVVKRRAAA